MKALLVNGQPARARLHLHRAVRGETNAGGKRRGGPAAAHRHTARGRVHCLRPLCAHGRCVFDDKVNEVLETLDEYSAIVLGSPVYYASASGQVCAFADRLF